MATPKRVHPDYGTCPGCTQARRLRVDGTFRDHNCDIVGFGGNAKITVECRGSGMYYTEMERNGYWPKIWDAQNSRWFDLPIQVSTTVHDATDELDLIVIEAHAFTDTKAGYALYIKRQLAMHIFLTEHNSYANTYRAELRTAEDEVLFSEESVRDDGSLNGLMLRWLTQLAEAEKSKP